MPAARVIDLLDGVHAKLAQTDFEVTDPGDIGGGDGDLAGDHLESTGERNLTEDPEIHAAIASHIAHYETSRVDSPIPALHGLTPPSCGRPNPARGPQRLLAEFPSTGSPLHMDAQRLRQLLDL